MQWHAQDGNITANINVEVDFTLHAISAMNIVTWKFMWMTPLREYVI